MVNTKTIQYRNNKTNLRSLVVNEHIYASVVILTI